MPCYDIDTNKKEAKYMWFVLVLAVAVLGICLSDGSKTKKVGLLGIVAAILYFPIGVIMALTKKYK